MIPVPSSRLAAWGVVLAAVSFTLLVFPGAWLMLLAGNLVLAGAALLDWLVTPGVDSVEVVRLAPDQASVLEGLVITLRVRNRSPVRLRLRLRDGVPESFRHTAEELSGEVPAAGEARWQYEATPQARGLFRWGPLQLRYRSVLGLWEFQKTVPAAGQLKVYPGLAQLHRYHLLARANRLDVLGIRKVRLRGGAWEFESLREYVAGDDARKIDWKATARRRKLIVRQHEVERNQTVILLVDSGRLMNAVVDGVAKLDHAINTALLLAHVALSRGDRVGLCTFSHKVHAWVAPRGHVAQMRVLTETLYALAGDFTETDHGRCLRFLTARHAKRALLVVLTDFVDAATAGDMIAHLQLAARRHVVLFAAFKDPFLEQAARSRPAAPREGFRKAAAVDLLRDRREVLERLRHSGMHVLDAEPADVTPPLINQYLEVTFRGLL